MRNGQNKRMRGRNNRKGHHHHNPLTRVYESNGPDVKIRGTAHHVAEKYLQLARDATSSGDPVTAENYFQHAEHYLRLIAGAQEQLRQQNPYYQQQQAGGAEDRTEPMYEDAEDAEDDRQPIQVQQQGAGQPQPMYAPRVQPQPYGGQQPQPQPDRPMSRPVQAQPQPYLPPVEPDVGTTDQLPSFITGNAPQPPQSVNGHDEGAGGEQRFAHRRRRYRGSRGGPRSDQPSSETRGGPTESGE